MSTYLVAFVVGHLEFVEGATGTPTHGLGLRLLYKRWKGNLAYTLSSLLVPSAQLKALQSACTHLSERRKADNSRWTWRVHIPLHTLPFSADSWPS
jgi:hypothetical protein